MKPFIYKLLVFSALCGLLLFCWNRFTPAEMHDSASWYIFAFFTLTTAAVHFYLLQSASGDAKAFVYRFLGITGLKLFLYLVFLVIMFLTNRDHARTIALYFLIMYLLFTLFEVSSLYRRLKK